MKLSRATVAGVVAAAALVIAGCSAPSSTTGSTTSAESSTGGNLTGELTVSAASSLKKGFDQLRTEFQAANPGLTFTDIQYNGSSTLATQIQGGAAVDVFASADNDNMDKVRDLVDGTPIQFATNTLQIAVQPGNPKGIKSLADLAKPDITVVLCADGVPCGTAARRALAAARVRVNPVSEEQNVTEVLSRVANEDADAGMVYKTDVLGSAGKAEGVSFPEAAAATNNYPIAVLEDAKNLDAARAFVAYVAGPEGQKVLANLGFGPPAS